MPRNQDPKTLKSLDEVSNLIIKFDDVANRIATKYRIGIDWIDNRGGKVRVRRYKARWTLMWADEEREQPLKEAPIAAKRAFLTAAAQFFTQYHKKATTFEETVGDDLAAGARALAKVEKLD